MGSHRTGRAVFAPCCRCPTGAGRLVLGRPARTRAAVELVHGENILAASSLIDWTNRFSNYTLLGQQPGSDFLTGSEAAHVIGNSVDRGVTRFRPLTILAEQGLTDQEALARIEWEASVRAARARSAAVSVQGWRETPDGDLWEPGRLVIVSDPWLGLERELLISGVRQAITERGTTTTLQLYPEGAFFTAGHPSAGSHWFICMSAEFARVFRRLIRPLESRVKLMIGRAVLHVLDDDRKLQAVQVQAFAGEVLDNVERFQQYGFSGSPHPGAECVLLSLGGMRQHPIVVAIDDRRFRPSGLSEGEVVIYTSQDPEEAHRIWLKNGHIVPDRRQR